MLRLARLADRVYWARERARLIRRTVNDEGLKVYPSRRAELGAEADVTVLRRRAARQAAKAPR